MLRGRQERGPRRWASSGWSLQRQSLSGVGHPLGLWPKVLTLLQLTLARSPQVYAASARLSIQEEQGAPGGLVETTTPQDALRRAFTGAAYFRMAMYIV